MFARLLIQRGANVNIVNENGNTALHFAAAKGNSEAPKIFKSNGKDSIKYPSQVSTGSPQISFGMVPM